MDRALDTTLKGSIFDQAGQTLRLDVDDDGGLEWCRQLGAINANKIAMK